MTWRLFIDECLSPTLVAAARNAGCEATCSRDRGLLGAKDWTLLRYIVNNDFTLVTKNSRDFRGHGSSSPGGLYAKLEIHAGLICLNSHFVMVMRRQRRLFDFALRELALCPDLTNMALEIFEHKNGEISCHLYDIPASTT
jgi:hypothetical protein